MTNDIFITIKRNPFILFEGMDCTGKTSAIRALQKEYECNVMAFPQDREILEDKTSYIEDPLNAILYHRRFKQEFITHQSKIKGNLDSGWLGMQRRPFLMDRYIFSHYAYLMKDLDDYLDVGIDSDKRATVTTIVHNMLSDHYSCMVKPDYVFFLFSNKTPPSKDDQKYAKCYRTILGTLGYIETNDNISYIEGLRGDDTLNEIRAVLKGKKYV